MSLIFQWFKTLHSTYNEFSDAPKPSVDVDLNGNIYIAFVTLNPQDTGQTNVGLIDICVVKYDSDGNLLWYRQQPSFDTSEDDVDPDICVDSFGNVYVAYCTNGSISGQTEQTLTVDIVVFKMNTNGDTIWVKQSSQFSTSGNDYMPSIAVDGSSNIYIAYYSNDPTQPTEYYDNINLFKMSGDGEVIWVKKTQTFNTPGGNYNPSIDVDDDGNCYVAYFCDGADPASGETSVGQNDIVVFKTNTNGDMLWIRERPTFDTDDIDTTPSIVVDSNGSSYIAYVTRGTVVGQEQTGNYDIAVMKMDTNGNVIWVTQKPSFNTDDADLTPSIGLDQLGMLYVTYSTSGITSGQTMSGNPDIVVVQFDNNGKNINTIQQKAFNTNYENVFPSITVDINGNCYITYYSINPGDETVDPSQDLVIFKMSSIVCIIGETNILMGDGSTKLIKNINRGDIVAPNNQVARLCREKIDYSSNIDLMIFEKKCLGNKPSERLVITPNHPMFYKNARRPAKCFTKCNGVQTFIKKPISEISGIFNKYDDIYLYDLQFDHDGSYIANGVEIQSRSPNSYYNPLPKELYYDQSLYSNEVVWDSLDHDLPLDSSILDFNILILKNKRHKNSTEIGSNSNFCSITQYS